MRTSPSIRRHACLASLLVLPAAVACATGSVGGTTAPGGGASDGGLLQLPDGGGVIVFVGGSSGTGTGTGTTTGFATSSGTTDESSAESSQTATGGDCISGETMCATGCTDTSSDPDNCGTCGNVCSTSSCTGGSCGGSTGFDAGDGFDAGEDEDSGLPGYTCSHSPCAPGVALDPSCDYEDNRIVDAVCSVDSDCCSHNWSNTCATLAEEACTEHGHDLCVEPGC